MNLVATRALLRAVAQHHTAVLVGLSGKDSLCTLALCHDLFPRVECFTMTLVPGLACVERPATEAAQRFGVALHFVEHPMASVYRKRGQFGLANRVAYAQRARKQSDVEHDLRTRTGIQFIAYGHRQNDSVQRRAMLRRLQPPGLDSTGQRIYPIWNWTTADVRAYLRARRLPLPERIAARGQGSGSGLSLNRSEVLWLYQHHRSDYDQLERHFPFIGAWLARERFAHQDPGVHD